MPFPCNRMYNCDQSSMDICVLINIPTQTLILSLLNWPLFIEVTKLSKKDRSMMDFTQDKLFRSTHTRQMSIETVY